MDGELQRQSQKSGWFAGSLDQIYEAQGFPIGPEQDMQPVVEPRNVGFDAARAAAEYPACFEYGDRYAFTPKFRGRRHACVTATNYGHARPRLAV